MDSRTPARVTARPADKRTTTDRLDPALMRRLVTARCALTGERRKVARAAILGALGRGVPFQRIVNACGIADPTGETAVSNVARGGGRRG